jgi:hypothetical protein
LSALLAGALARLIVGCGTISQVISGWAEAQRLRDLARLRRVRDRKDLGGLFEKRPRAGW